MGDEHNQAKIRIQASGREGIALNLQVVTIGLETGILLVLLLDLWWTHLDRKSRKT